MTSAEDVIALLAEVKDPEIPVLSIADLGILQQVKVEDETFKIGIIATYSGCPAMHAIKQDIATTLQKHGIKKFNIQLLDQPIWTTNMMTESGKLALKKFGIAPPVDAINKVVSCPLCHSKNTELISQFGSTACKSMYRCQDCLEPFDYFKCHA